MTNCVIWKEFGVPHSKGINFDEFKSGRNFIFISYMDTSFKIIQLPWGITEAVEVLFRIGSYRQENLPYLH
jgi:hypothetical protein